MNNSDFPKGIIANQGESLTFGNFKTKYKIKVDDFEHKGDLYSLRAHDVVTRLEKNGELLLEATPGAYLVDFTLDGIDGCSFEVFAKENVQITLSLSPEVLYNIVIDGGEAIHAAASRSGKVSFGVELAEGASKKIIVRRSDD